MNNLKNETQELLQQHWLLDELTAESLSGQLSIQEADSIKQSAGMLDEVAAKQREVNVTKFGRILTNATTKKLAILGPCSLDEQTDVSRIFDFVHRLQADHPNILIATRLNGAKPRSKGGWTGLWSSLDTGKRQHLFDAMIEANTRDIPVVTEITEPMQFGALAPLLSGIWLGARDVTSTALRAMASATRMPVGLKNGTDGSIATVENTIKAIKLSSQDTDSGVDFGTIASSPTSRGVPTGILPVGEGNPNLGIIARGHEVTGNPTPIERHQLAVNHLGNLCRLAVEQGTGVIIDGSHDVPQMFAIPRTDAGRFPKVMDILLDAIASGDIAHPEAIKGVMCEIGPQTGKTDPNWIMDHTSSHQLHTILSRLEEL